ncbi:hypothetical protein SAY87_003823 [Trapa incisa]|uniref:Uncharacterized protein n=2 Tax=Trapa TaxID=22665 RepID=A0AAN7L794_TRANT|nr:hypothetical protein SAY87_003823 [Trapa incisa]KAK4778874.1 hypothetical protein SAY86_006402 [Trapa natans]
MMQIPRTLVRFALLSHERAMDSRMAEHASHMRMVLVVVIICVMLTAARMSAREDEEEEGHLQSLMAATTEEYGNWGPAPDSGGGSAGPIPHSGSPYSWAGHKRQEAASSGLAASSYRG